MKKGMLGVFTWGGMMVCEICSRVTEPDLGTVSRFEWIS